MKTKRDLKLDIIRLFALLCVVSVHFFRNTNFYSTSVSGTNMFIMIVIRSFFIICVPLFIILTGYLMNRKKLQASYYKGIIRILIIYLICSVIYHIYSYFYLDTPVTIKSFIYDLITYNGTEYAWYLNLYIGLFLLIPFLNMIVDNIKDKKTFNYLLLTLFVITGLPSFLIIYHNFLPTFWISIYPIFYYFLGVYLSRYEINLSVKKCLLFLIGLLIIDGIINYSYSYGRIYRWNKHNDYSGGMVMLTSFLTFNMLLKIKVTYNEKKEKILKTLSNAVFGAYLLSCIFDDIIYDYFFTRTIYAPLLVLSVYILSLLSSIIINYIYDKVKLLFNKT